MTLVARHELRKYLTAYCNHYLSVFLFSTSGLVLKIPSQPCILDLQVPRSFQGELRHGSFIAPHDKQQYNATLLFYPSLPDREIDKYSHRSSSVSYGDDSIIPSGRPEGRFPTVAPRTPSPTFEPFIDVDDLQPTEKGKGKAKARQRQRQGKGKGKGKKLHKRQISEAIPSAERDEQAVTEEGTRKGPARVRARVS